MAAMGDDKNQAIETTPNNSSHHHHPIPNNENKTQTSRISLYEQSREERIKENLHRMQQLGLKDLSNSLLNSNSHISSRRGRGRQRPVNGSKTPVTPQVNPSPPSSASLRRSSRLQNATPVTYSEAALAKNDELLEDVEMKLRASEVYTEEHEKLLGNTERSWTLFVDGYGSDGKRIYDCVKGKTCHQCRQKTLGHHTHCSNCNLVQGQFCGDCLYMRYGEHVLEAMENPNWLCPVCRGICNCSLCRQAKGWAPTGSLYRKISQMGFKSVAHYLIQTRRAQTNTEKKPDNVDKVFAKRSLSFPPEEESSKDESNQKSQSGDDALNCEIKENIASLEPNPSINHLISTRKSLQFAKHEADFEKEKSTEINLEVFSEPGSGNKKDDDLKCEHEKELHFSEEEPGKKHALTAESNPNNIAGRQGHGQDVSHNDGTMWSNKEVLDAKQTVNHVFSGNNVVKERETHDAEEDIFESHEQLGFSELYSGEKKVDDFKCEREKELHLSEEEPGKKHAFSAEPNPDNIAGRQGHGQDVSHNNNTVLDAKQTVNHVVSENNVVKERETHSAEEDIVEGYIAPESSPKLLKRPASAVKHSPDSIPERLKQRRRQGQDHDEQEPPVANESVSHAKQAVEQKSSRKESEANLKHSSGTNMDCVARRLRPRNKAL